MSLAGVRSNRGDGYQTLVAFDWALSIIAGDKYQWLEVDSTFLDVTGNPLSVDDVVIGCADGSLICCQCKKNQKDFEAWSVADLGEEITKAARFLANHPRSQVKFYTRGNFGALAKLREYSITQPNEAVYRQNLTQEHQKTDTALAKHLSKVVGLNTFDWLRRTTFETSPELERMHELLMERLNRLVSNANNAFQAFWTKLDMLGARIGDGRTASAQPYHRFTKSDLLSILEKSGATFVPPMSQQDMQRAFAGASAVGRSWRRDIAGKRFQVSAVSELIASLESENRSILLSGTPGAGKTCVLLELQETLERRNDLAGLFIQAREYADCITPEARTAHGLPEDLVGLVGRMTDCKPTVVIIDSLDVLSLAREHNVLSFFLAQIDRLLLIPRVTVIAACRDFDRKYDRRLAERSWDRIINNKPLDWEALVAPLVSDYGIDPASLEQSTRSLLQNPRELAMFAVIAQHTGGFNVASSQALSRKYLETIVQNDRTLGSEAMLAIEQMAEKMLVSRRLDIPRIQTRITDAMLDRLLSAAVLHQNQSGNIEFGHQTLLDVLVVSGAERNGLSLKAFIEQLPAVPFVRPTIRAYVAYLAAGDRLNFRKQLRSVFESNAAFHIKRLVAESFAGQTPQDDDWPLIKHLHSQHRELFKALYWQAISVEWHYFWLKFLVPYVVQQQDAQSLAEHVHRIEVWKNIDPKGVVAFWLQSMQQKWADIGYNARNIPLQLTSFDFSAEVDLALLIETLLTQPRRDHNLLGDAIARCVDAGKVGDELLWDYIAGDISEQDVLEFHFNSKLRCQPHEFHDKDFLQKRMCASERLLNLAMCAVEQWSAIKDRQFSYAHCMNERYLVYTSFEGTHSQHDFRHVEAEHVLFKALEMAIRHHAKEHTDWWTTQRQRLCCSREGALCYLAILALAESPERNTAEVARLVSDKNMLASKLRFEIGTLIQASFLYLDEHAQDAVLSAILTLRDDENFNEKPWILDFRAELLSAIPVYLRSPEAQALLDSWEKSFGSCIRQPLIYSRGGRVAPPFSYERFFEFTDVSVLKILSHYTKEGRSNWEYDFLVGGAEEVEWQLREAASRAPIRFMHLLHEHWSDIPERFTNDILDGVAAYLSHRHGNLHFDAKQWIPLEEPEPQILAGLLLDEIERHSVRWHHCRAAAKALAASAHVIENDHDATRLVFFALDFINLHERTYDDGRDLIGAGINMIRGEVVESLMILATRWAKAQRAFPELLIPTLKRFSRDSQPAIRALILRRLPYLQSHQPDLGWEIFHRTMENEDERLWEIAEPCLYYAYHKHFDIVSPLLEHIASTASGKPLETWGQISALAVLSGLLELQHLVSRLRTFNSIDAWKGAASVWTHKGNIAQHTEKCLFGMQACLAERTEIASSVARKLSSIFDEKHPLTIIPPGVVDKYLSAIEQDQSSNRFHLLYGFGDWLNALSLQMPDEALTMAERFAVFVRRTNQPPYDRGNISQLLTRLFREAEEREETDDGTMLRRVIALQDAFLAFGVNGLQDWLRDAERP